MLNSRARQRLRRVPARQIRVYRHLSAPRKCGSSPTEIGDKRPRAEPTLPNASTTLVARIPYGRVTTYGRSPGRWGAANGARWSAGRSTRRRRTRVPCHRVVNRIGYLSGGWHFGHPDMMRDAGRGGRAVRRRVPGRPQAALGPGPGSAAADEVDDLEQIPRRGAGLSRSRLGDDLPVALDDDQRAPASPGTQLVL